MRGSLVCIVGLIWLVFLSIRLVNCEIVSSATVLERGSVQLTH